MFLHGVVYTKYILRIYHQTYPYLCLDVKTRKYFTHNSLTTVLVRRHFFKNPPKAAIVLAIEFNSHYGLEQYEKEAKYKRR